jgi:uncharacterized protein YerC
MPGNRQKNRHKLYPENRDRIRVKLALRTARITARKERERMRRTCTICKLQNAEINSMLVDGVPLRRIAKQSGTSVTALHRHKRHLPATLAIAKKAEQKADSQAAGTGQAAHEATRKSGNCWMTPSRIERIPLNRQFAEQIANLPGLPHEPGPNPSRLAKLAAILRDGTFHDCT